MNICKSIIFVVFVMKVTCYEKTLRKIVRNKSKMVQMPYSANDPAIMFWKNSSSLMGVKHKKSESIFSAFSPRKTVYHKKPYSVKASRLSPVIESPRVLTSKMDKTTKSSHDLRLTKHTLNILPSTSPSTKDNSFKFQFNLSVTPSGKDNSALFQNNYSIDSFSNNSFRDDGFTLSYYDITSKPNLLSTTAAENVEEKVSNDNALVVPGERSYLRRNATQLMKSIFISNQPPNIKYLESSSDEIQVMDENDKADFIIQVKPIAPIVSPQAYNISEIEYECKPIKKVTADIDAQAKFAEFDIEPPWKSKKHFWNHFYDSRFESLMRNPKWPPLKVILVPRTQVDSLWKKTFERYHIQSVHKILSNIVKKLQFYSNLTFTWNEVSHLSKWWKNTTPKRRTAFRRLVKAGRLEITTGGWVEPDEATTDLFGLIHQLVEGHQWLKNNLNYSPKVAWLTNSVTHSPTVAYLLSAAGINNLVLTNLHYSWEEYLAEFQRSDFIWLQNWNSDNYPTTTLNSALNKIGTDRLPSHSVFTHFLQFNSAGFKACGPKAAVCSSDFNFAKSDVNVNIHQYNVQQKSELLLEQYSKTGTMTPHNTIIAPIGGPYRYESLAEFDYQYNNYQRLADYINANRELYKATIRFGTPNDYFNTVFESHKDYPTLKGDFLNFADLNSGIPAYWTGYFTTRPLFKILLRRLQSTLRSTEILFSFAISLNAFHNYNATGLFQLLLKARERMAHLLDRNSFSGTLPAMVIRHAHKYILTAVKDCWHIQEVAASLVSTKPERRTPYLQKYVYRDGEFVTIFRTISPGDQIYVFNSVSHDRTEIIDVIVRNPNIRIIDHKKNDLVIQINPVWKYNSDNLISVSRRFFKVSFAVTVPPLTFELFQVKDTYDATQHAAAVYCVSCVVNDVNGDVAPFPFNFYPLEAGDVQLESYKYRLIFDELTGFLKIVVEKETNTEKTVVLDYGAFRSSDVNSGMFLFKTNDSKPLEDILMPYRIGAKSRTVIILAGQVCTEVTSIYGRLLQNTIKLFNLADGPLSKAIYVESKVDYEVSPKNRELEMFLSIQTDIGNGNPPEIFIDNNGFQYTGRMINISKRLESNVYPLTTAAFIQDRKSRLTFITDHAQGVTALQEGQLVVMLDRRILFDDGRGSNEGLADSGATCHRNFILLENLFESTNSHDSSSSVLQMPSLTALNLVNSLNHIFDIFIIDKNVTEHSYYAFLPLIKRTFPCDVHLINYRVTVNKGFTNQIPNTALMILQRQTHSCNIVYNGKQCNGDNGFRLDRILHNVKGIYLTNLVGTDVGIPTSYFSDINFPAMEVLTIRTVFNY